MARPDRYRIAVFGWSHVAKWRWAMSGAGAAGGETTRDGEAVAWRVVRRWGRSIRAVGLLGAALRVEMVLAVLAGAYNRIPITISSMAVPSTTIAPRLTPSIVKPVRS